MLYSYTALSVLLSFLVTEFTGLFTGGLVSAGYLAFYFTSPLRILATFLSAVIITLIVRLLRRFMIIYGRRRFMICVMLSLFFVWASEQLGFFYANFDVDLRIVGYIIPGLIASDMERQGIIRTLGSCLSIMFLIRLISILLEIL